MSPFTRMPPPRTEKRRILMTFFRLKSIVKAAFVPFTGARLHFS